MYKNNFALRVLAVRIFVGDTVVDLIRAVVIIVVVIVIVVTIVFVVIIVVIVHMYGVLGGDMLITC
jgi:hypothetical protein